MVRDHRRRPEGRADEDRCDGAKDLVRGLDHDELRRVLNEGARASGDLVHARVAQQHPEPQPRESDDWDERGEIVGGHHRLARKGAAALAHDRHERHKGQQAECPAPEEGRVEVLWIEQRRQREHRR